MLYIIYEQTIFIYVCILFGGAFMESTLGVLKITETTIKGRKRRFLVLEVDEEVITLGYLDNFNNLHLR